MFILNIIHAIGTMFSLYLKMAPSVFCSPFVDFFISSYYNRIVSQSLPFRIAIYISYSIIVLFLYLPLLLITSTLGIAVFIVFLTLIISVLIVWSLGIVVSFLVWLLLYRIPLYDIIYPRISRWMLQHNLTVYHHLPQGADAAGSYIRVVRIKPANPREIIECELVTEDIATAEYDALSYLWGTTIFPYKIKVDGNDFYVTYNLFSALRELRRPDRDRLIWIDALCINQSDDAEKSNQVRLMRTIYAKASNVIVWLGTGSKATTSACDFVRRFRDTSIEEDRDHLWAKLISSGDWRHIRMEFGRIISHEWWTRVWIIQEVVVARHVLIRRGSAELDWDTLQPLFMYTPFQEMFGSESTDFAANIQYLRNEILADNPTPITLFDHVYKFRHQSATLASDKIYALLGLLRPGFNSRVSPD